MSCDDGICIWWSLRKLDEFGILESSELIKLELTLEAFNTLENKYLPGSFM